MAEQMLLREYENGSKKLVKVNNNPTTPRKKHNRSKKEEAIHKRTCNLRKQYETVTWECSITLTVINQQEPEVLVEKCKELMKHYGLTYFCIVQSRKNSKKKSKGWHIHGVIDTRDYDIIINLMDEWCSYFPGTNIKAQDIRVIENDEVNNQERWFGYFIRRLADDSDFVKNILNKTTRLTFSNCKSQKKCKIKTIFIDSDENIRFFQKKYEGRNLRGKDLDDFERICFEKNEGKTDEITLETDEAKKASVRKFPSIYIRVCVIGLEKKCVNRSLKDIVFLLNRKTSKFLGRPPPNRNKNKHIYMRAHVFFANRIGGDFYG